MKLEEYVLKQKVKYIKEKQPQDFIPSKGNGIVVGITKTALIIKWENGSIEMVHPDDLEIIK